MCERIFLSSPHMSSEGYELNYVKGAFETNWIAPLGPNVDSFETEFAKKIGAKHAVVLSSGTAAIHLALKSAGVKAGDIVFCQSLTFSATANPIIYLNAVPVFLDSDEKSWNMCPNMLKRAFKIYDSKGRLPKAVIGVHLYGLAADMDPILSLCRSYDVPFIEDAAESLGTLYKGQFTGCLGDYGIFSFNGNKIITTSGGGMVVADDQKKTDKIRFWATQSKDPARHYQHSELGYNYRLSNVAAGIGRGQLKVLDERILKKRYIFEFYKKELAGLEGIKFMPENDWNEPNCWLTCITINGKIKPVNVMDALERNNIESRPIWKPMHLQPFFKKYDYIGSDVSEYIFKHGICLPSDTKMTDGDLMRICAIVKSLWNQ